jgi:hypothetical protein
MTAGRRRGRATICVNQSSSTIANAIGVAIHEDQSAL